MLEVWGGHECTVNRVGDRHVDQTIRSGHHERLDDLDRFAGLGLKALRYPVLWERTAANGPDDLDWSWSDARLRRLDELRLRPIVGLLHHGSGPAHTHLLDPAFPARFAAYARAAAERYPWVAAWTPINEPLTTARFSALYGHWYPHARDERAFWIALLNQIDGVRLAMHEILAVNPAAQLVQTEDLGRTYGRGGVAEQVAFDNHRRWMTWDLLAGAVSPGHPLWDHLIGLGFEVRLRAIAEGPCPPDILGINHYPTSDRFLDGDTSAYPAGDIGGNGRIAYADVAALRVAAPTPGGLEGALAEAWRRYGRPIAVTECHNGCTREEQVRWLRDAWDTATQLRARGADIRAVTAWALLGSHDWSSLLTREASHYEPGAFDVRGPGPRETAVAAEIRRLARGEGSPHPAMHGPGWWRRDVRLLHRPAVRDPAPATTTCAGPQEFARPLLITGATGTLGQALGRACAVRGLAYRLTDRARLPLDDPERVAEVLDALDPWGVVNAAGWVRLDEAEGDPRGCFRDNATAAETLALACAGRGLPYLAYSSDQVFGGGRTQSYVESDAVAPCNVYGASKVAAERAIAAAGGAALVVRTAAFFSPHDPYNFAAAVVRALGAGQTFQAAADLVISPTYVPDLVDASLDLLLDGVTGVRHLANAGACSWFEFARKLAVALSLDPDLITAVPAASFGWAAARPVRSPLGTEHGQILAPLDDAIARFAAASPVSAHRPCAEAGVAA